MLTLSMLRARGILNGNPRLDFFGGRFLATCIGSGGSMVGIGSNSSGAGGSTPCSGMSWIFSLMTDMSLP